MALDFASLLVTTRPLSSFHLQNIPEKLALQPFDKARIIEYASKWYGSAPLLTEEQREINPTPLVEGWLRDSTLYHLISVPLMLATVLMVHHMDGTLPHGRSKLYERYINGMLGIWDGRWGVPASVKIEPDRLRQLLMSLAIQMHLEEVEEISDEKISRLLNSILQDLSCDDSVDSVLNHIRERSGLLVGPGSWSFVHKSVGEFLVACAVHDGSYSDKDQERIDRLMLFRKRHDDRWNSVLFFWAGYTTGGELRNFIDDLISAGDADDLSLAAGLILDQKDSVRLARDWIDLRVTRILSSKKLFSERTPEPKFVGQKIGHDIWGVYVCTNVYLKMTCHIPVQDIPYRGMNANSEFNYNVASMLFSSSGLAWGDLKDANVDVLPLIWTSQLNGARDLELFRLLLSELGDDGRMNKAWLAHVMSHSLWSLVYEKPRIEACDFFAEIEKVFPAMKDSALIWLLNIIIYIESRKDLIGRGMDVEKYWADLRYFSDRNVSADILTETLNWGPADYFPLETTSSRVGLEFFGELRRVLPKFKEGLFDGGVFNYIENIIMLLVSRRAHNP